MSTYVESVHHTEHLVVAGAGRSGEAEEHAR